MHGLIEQSRAFAQAVHGEIPDWVAWRLQRMEEERFIAEALAFEVIGRFEHPQTKSVRMESAIAKMLVSELLHRVIELAEEIHGLAGQTQLHLVEKRKRDARVLNIYEGTNEVQRFFILRDLVAIGAKKAKDERKTQHTGPEALQLETLRGLLGQRLTAAVAVFGQELGQNPNLQANCFSAVGGGRLVQGRRQHPGPAGLAEPARDGERRWQRIVGGGGTIGPERRPGPPRFRTLLCRSTRTPPSLR